MDVVVVGRAVRRRAVAEVGVADRSRSPRAAPGSGRRWSGRRRRPCSWICSGVAWPRWRTAASTSRRCAVSRSPRPRSRAASSSATAGQRGTVSGTAVDGRPLVGRSGALICAPSRSGGRAAPGTRVRWARDVERPPSGHLADEAAGRSVDEADARGPDDCLEFAGRRSGGSRARGLRNHGERRSRIEQRSRRATSGQSPHESISHAFRGPPPLSCTTSLRRDRPSARGNFRGGSPGGRGESCARPGGPLPEGPDGSAGPAPGRRALSAGR